MLLITNALEFQKVTVITDILDIATFKPIYLYRFVGYILVDNAWLHRHYAAAPLKVKYLALIRECILSFPPTCAPCRLFNDSKPEKGDTDDYQNRKDYQYDVYHFR
jgi:hypothetical protein